MKHILTVAATLFCMTGIAQKDNTLTSAEKKDGWQLVFDGKSTKGWHTYNKGEANARWKVAEGVLALDTTVKEGGDLVYEKTLADFDLKLEWKISKNGNSGVMFYVQEDKKYDYPFVTGPEMQVLDNDGHPDGKIIKHRAGDLYDLIKSTKETVKPVGEWNQAEIISNKGELTFILNGEKAVHTTLWSDEWKALIAGSKFKDMPDFGKFQAGKIVLQDHGNGVYFRNIKVKEL